MNETNDGLLVESLNEEGPRLLIGLSEQACADTDLAGGKASNLAKLLQAGFPVPEGFVVTTLAHAAYMPHLPDKASIERVREHLRSIPLDTVSQYRLSKAVERLESPLLAVRSSGTAEDSRSASFAGQYDTFLQVEGSQQVELAVRKCWASALGDHLLHYREQQQVQAGAMAVLIQPMLAPDAAGVAFTANPVNGDRSETVVSAVRGLGERLVSGTATPDEWSVRGNEATNMSAPEQAVDREQVLRIAELARKTEAFFGQPQDIEWAICGEKLYLLQARPITTLDRLDSATSQQEPRFSEAVSEVPILIPDGYWEREASHYPDPLSPATRSTFIPAMNHAMRLMCSQMSLMIETLEQRPIGGWMYQRTVPLGGKDRAAPPDWLMPVLIRVVPSIRSRIAGAVQAVRQDVGGHTLASWEREWKPDLIRRTEALASVDLQALSNRELKTHLGETKEFLNVCLDRHMLMNGALQLALAEFAFMCRDRFGWGDSETMECFEGLSVASSAPAREMSGLARRVHAVPDLYRRLEAGAPLSELRELDREFANELDAYLRLFGNRALRSELAYPTLSESPELLVQLLRSQTRDEYDSERKSGLHAQRRGERLAIAANELGKCSEPDRRRFNHLLARAETAYAVREEHGFYDRDAPFALLRYALLEAGRRFAEQRRLDRQSDVFLLEFDETQTALENEVAVIRDTAERRQSEMNWTRLHLGPASYGDIPPPPPSFASFPAEARLSAEAAIWAIERIFATDQSGQAQTDPSRIRGISASAGPYTGTVRIVRDESEFGKIRKGDVLVCPITTPAWSVLFPSIGALVTDSGGILSHSAIIAREYGIPSVVATGNATELLRDGQVVVVDGARGIVETR
ncbi:PEP/pyruvate-binding domain-containing protein [Saccharibacillus sacchari]|uniref:PEP/pyruvate-binding domain-containing protein n=1 Tax=Saccharibacillus sacchari TaxID=456493 RepID=A0ACC6P7S2_9BACL